MHHLWLQDSHQNEFDKSWKVLSSQCENQLINNWLSPFYFMQFFFAVCQPPLMVSSPVQGLPLCMVLPSVVSGQIVPGIIWFTRASLLCPTSHCNSSDLTLQHCNIVTLQPTQLEKNRRCSDILFVQLIVFSRNTWTCNLLLPPIFKKTRSMEKI